MTGRPAEQVTGTAPGRVNLIGEHTDYNGGLALPLALPRRTTATVRVRDDGEVTALSTALETEPVEFGVDTAPGDVTGWGGYVAGVYWALRQAGHDVPGADIRISSDVPVGAGLSSSAALECAVVVALDRVAGLELDTTTMALLAQRAENDYVGAPTGGMDQMVAMHGRAGHVILFDAAKLTTEPVPCDLEDAGLALLIVDTGAPHRHVSGEYGARRRSCEEAARALGVATLRDVQDDPVDQVLLRLRDSSARPAETGRPDASADDVTLRRVRHVLTENARVLSTVRLLRAGQLAEIGPLLTASHASLRDDYEVTVPELDLAVDTALAAGALGARMTGGGFGGSIIALVETARASLVADRIRAAFAREGFGTVEAFAAIASPGATAVDGVAG